MNDSHPPSSCDVLVLGAGIVGIALALKLQAFGRDVVLLDRGEPGAATSFGNAGLIERSSVLPYAFPRDWHTLLDHALQRKLATRYHWRALPFIARWLMSYWRHSSAALYPAAIAGALPLVEHSWTEHAPLIEAADAGALVNEHGWIKVFRSDASRSEALELAERSRSYGVRAQQLSAEELREREPALAGTTTRSVACKAVCKARCKAVCTTRIRGRFAIRRHCRTPIWRCSAARADASFTVMHAVCAARMAAGWLMPTASS